MARAHAKKLLAVEAAARHSLLTGILSLLLTVFTLAACADASAADTISPVNRLDRVALIIGNANYAAAPLKNPHNDARASNRD